MVTRETEMREICSINFQADQLPRFSTKYVAHCFVNCHLSLNSFLFQICAMLPCHQLLPSFPNMNLWTVFPPTMMHVAPHLSLWLLSSVCSLLLAEALLHKWYGIQRIFGQSLLQIVCFWSATQKLTSRVVKCLKKFNMVIMNASFALVWYILDYIHNTYI